jgi:lauroyl/myristoyl acyltransferase
MILHSSIHSRAKAVAACFTHAIKLFLPSMVMLHLSCLAYSSAKADEMEDAQRHPFSPARLISSLEKLVYLLIIVPIVSFFPAPIAYGVACRRGDWSYKHDFYVRERIMQGLVGVLGEQLSLEERKRVTHEYFRRRSCEAIDVMRLAGKGKRLARLVEIRGLEHIEAALQSGNGAIICSAHYGLFNGGCSLIGSLGFPITAVGDWKTSVDPHMSIQERLFWRYGFEKRVDRHRQRPSIEPQKEKTGVAIRMAEILRANELLAIPIDTPPPPEDRGRVVEVDFLGRQIQLLSGSVLIAQLTRAQILVLVAHRQTDWCHQILEIVPVPFDGDAQSVFKRCIELVETPIRQRPAYWNGWENLEELADLGLL